MAKWLSHSFDRTILRKRERGSRPSYPSILVFKKPTRTFNFLRLLVNIYVTYELAYVTNFRIRMFYYVYKGCDLRLYTKA